LVAFRITDEMAPDGKWKPCVEVALVARGSDSLRWVKAEDGKQPILSESAADRWLDTSTFTAGR
jgi:hypothetical protein